MSIKRINFIDSEYVLNNNIRDNYLILAEDAQDA
jgi:hypothetical protein